MELIIEQVKKLRVEKRAPTPQEYWSLTGQSDRSSANHQFSKTAFGKEVYSVVVLDGSKMVGMGRVIGDGAIYFTIQDIIVHPNYDSKSVSNLIIGDMEAYFKTIASPHVYIGLTATNETRELYEKYGFTERKTKNHEMFRILIKENSAY